MVRNSVKIDFCGSIPKYLFYPIGVLSGCFYAFLSICGVFWCVSDIKIHRFCARCNHNTSTNDVKLRKYVKNDPQISQNYQKLAFLGGMRVVMRVHQVHTGCRRKINVFRARWNLNTCTNDGKLRKYVLHRGPLRGI